MLLPSTDHICCNIKVININVVNGINSESINGGLNSLWGILTLGI